MTITTLEGFEKPRLKVFLDHFAVIETPRAVAGGAPLPEVLLLVICCTICDCVDYDLIVDWGAAQSRLPAPLPPYYHGVPGWRWLTMRRDGWDSVSLTRSVWMVVLVGPFTVQPLHYPLFADMGPFVFTPHSTSGKVPVAGFLSIGD